MHYGAGAPNGTNIKKVARQVNTVGEHQPPDLKFLRVKDKTSRNVLFNSRVTYV